MPSAEPEAKYFPSLLHSTQWTVLLKVGDMDLFMFLSYLQTQSNFSTHCETSTSTEMIGAIDHIFTFSSAPQVANREPSG